MRGISLAPGLFSARPLGAQTVKKGRQMNLGLWIAAVGGLWLMSSVVLGLILGPILGRRGEQLPLVYSDQPLPRDEPSYRAPVETIIVTPAGRDSRFLRNPGITAIIVGDS